MGQFLHNAPTVEGWHTGKEWIDGGTLTERVNFAVNEMADVSKPGIQDIIQRLQVQGTAIAPETFVDTCLDLMGPLEMGDEARQALSRYANSGGELHFGTPEEEDALWERTEVRGITLIPTFSLYGRRGSAGIPIVPPPRGQDTRVFKHPPTSLELSSCIRIESLPRRNDERASVVLLVAPLIFLQKSKGVALTKGFGTGRAGLF